MLGQPWWAGLHALFFLAGPAVAQEAVEAGPSGLYDRPTLVLDPGVHTAEIPRADVNVAGRYAVTGSLDKTVRVWSVEDGHLLRTIRLPAGPGNIGKVYAIAISPDGEVIAAGGWTRWIEADPQEQIYLFDRATGAILRRVDGLPDKVKHLTFSADGRYLAATLGAAKGLRVYDRYDGWAEVARDPEYGDESYGADFSADGWLATTSFDGQVRLYDRSFHIVANETTAGGQQPYGIAFSPDGTVLAVGYYDSTAVELLDGRTLAPLSSPNTDGIDNGNLGTVAWSADGRMLFAGGDYVGDNISRPVVAWADAGAGARRALPAGEDMIISLAPLPKGDLLVAAADPYLAVLHPDGGTQWPQPPRQADFRGQRTTLAVAFDGQTVDFRYEGVGEPTARFDVSTGSLRHDLSADDKTTPPEHEDLPLQDWVNSPYPKLAGGSLSLDPYERSHSLAIHPDGKQFVLGTEWALRAYDAQGELLWRQDVPGVVWAVNISGDGRLVVAAYLDGTIRWHRMDDGKELLAFFPFTDEENWVAWTPEGYYASSAGMGELLGWHVNRGWDKPAEFYPISAIKGFFEPEVLARVLQELEIPRAIGLAKLARDRTRVQDVVKSAAPPGEQLHVLAIGISAYANNKHLTLDFADDDARDVANALLAQEGALYAKVNVQYLPDDQATSKGIFAALTTLNDRMQPEQGDLAVIHFSGHGTEVDGTYYLLPNDVEADDDFAIETSGIEIGRFERVLKRLGERGKVLVLLDACHSGNVKSGAKEGLPPDIDEVRDELAAAGNGVIVLTSSTGQEVSREDPDWQNGAFTEAVLEALQGKGDGNGDTWLSVAELEEYVTRRVRELTDYRQNPRISVLSEHHFQARLFVAGL